MKQWREIKQDFLNALVPHIEHSEANAVFKLIVEYFTELYPPNENLLNSSITAAEEKRVQEMTNRLLNDEPIQYILGYAWFYDLKLEVDSSVLIPRQETEELVHWIVQSYKHKRPLNIIDLGCGSGAISISLAKSLDATVTGIDISREAVNVSKKNAEWNRVSAMFVQADISNLPSFNQPFDIIVSNPPYIDINHKQNLPKNVLRKEPQIALFAPKGDVLYYYKAITAFAQSNLQTDGALFFEINEFYKKEIEQLLEDNGFGVEMKKDLNGNWRMVKALRI